MTDSTVAEEGLSKAHILALTASSRHDDATTDDGLSVAFSVTSTVAPKGASTWEGTSVMQDASLQTKPGAVAVRPSGAECVDDDELDNLMDPEDHLEASFSHVSYLGGTTPAVRREDLEVAARNIVLEQAVHPVRVQKVGDDDDEELSDDTKKNPNKRLTTRVLMGFLFMLLIVMGVAIGLGIGLARRDAGSSNDPSIAPKRAEDLSPSSAPSITYGSPGSITERIANSNITNIDRIGHTTPGTPANTALERICSDENVDCDNPQDPDALLELFALVSVLYFWNMADQVDEIVDRSVCSYPGIECHPETGLLRSLDFSNQGIFGGFPLEFSFFKEIEFLSLANNPTLGGEIHDGWGEQWLNIEHIDLSFTNLRGGPLANFVTNGQPLTTFRIHGTPILGNLGSRFCSAYAPAGPLVAQDIISNCKGAIDGELQQNSVFCSCCTTCCDASGANCTLVSSAGDRSIR